MHFGPLMIYGKFRRQYKSLQNITYQAGTGGVVDVQLYSFLTSALEGGGGGVDGQRQNQNDLPSGESSIPIYRRLGGPQGRSGKVWRRENLLSPLVIETRTVQTVASRYTDWANPDPNSLQLLH